MYNPNPLIHQQQMALSLNILRESIIVSAIEINDISLESSTPQETETMFSLNDEEIEARR